MGNGQCLMANGQKQGRQWSKAGTGKDYSAFPTWLLLWFRPVYCPHRNAVSHHALRVYTAELDTGAGGQQWRRGGAGSGRRCGLHGGAGQAHRRDARRGRAPDQARRRQARAWPGADEFAFQLCPAYRIHGIACVLNAVDWRQVRHKGSVLLYLCPVTLLRTAVCVIPWHEKPWAFSC